MSENSENASSGRRSPQAKEGPPLLGRLLLGVVAGAVLGGVGGSVLGLPIAGLACYEWPALQIGYPAFEVIVFAFTWGGVVKGAKVGVSAGFRDGPLFRAILHDLLGLSMLQHVLGWFQKARRRTTQPLSVKPHVVKTGAVTPQGEVGRSQGQGSVSCVVGKPWPEAPLEYTDAAWGRRLRLFLASSLTVAAGLLTWALHREAEAIAAGIAHSPEPVSGSQFQFQRVVFHAIARELGTTGLLAVGAVLVTAGIVAMGRIIAMAPAKPPPGSSPAPELTRGERWLEKGLWWLVWLVYPTCWVGAFCWLSTPDLLTRLLISWLMGVGGPVALMLAVMFTVGAVQIAIGATPPARKERERQRREAQDAAARRRNWIK